MDQYDITRSPSNLALLALRAPGTLESIIDPDAIALYRQNFVYLPVLPARSPDSMLLKAILADNQLEAYNCLLEGADPKACDEVGLTALHYAGQRGLIELMQALIKRGADINAVSIAGETPLAYAVACNAREFTPQSQTASFKRLDKVIDFYANKGANLDSQDIRGMTAVIHAASANDLVAMHILHRSGCDISLRDNLGNSAVHYAAAKLSPHATQQLMHWGLDPRAKGRSLTPRQLVMQAAGQNGSSPSLMATFNVLVKAEAIAHAREIAGLPVEQQDLLVEIDHPTAFRKIYDQSLIGGDIHLAIAALNSLSGVMKMPVPAENTTQNELFQATMRGDERTVVGLYESNQVSRRVRDYNGRTALSVAIIHGQTNIACAHLHYGVPLDLADCLQNTALHYAALVENDVMVAKLLEAGANPFIRNWAGRTPREESLLYNGESAKDSVTVNSQIFGGYPLKATKPEDQIGESRSIYLLQIAENEWQETLKPRSSAKKASGFNNH